MAPDGEPSLLPVDAILDDVGSFATRRDAQSKTAKVAIPSGEPRRGRREVVDVALAKFQRRHDQSAFGLPLGYHRTG